MNLHLTHKHTFRTYQPFQAFNTDSEPPTLYMQRSGILLLGLIVSTLIHCSAFADVYEHTDEAGIIHFSDTPVNERYVLILKSEESTTTTADTKLGASQYSTITSTVLTQPQLIAQIELSAQNNQLDRELIHAVIQVESAFKVQAQSNKGAQGLMQLMPATAKRFGVKDSYDPAQNIEGGAKYLRELLTLFNNDVSLALAAYNAGENAVIKYGNSIPPYKETQLYVPKVLGIYQALRKHRSRHN